MRRNWPFFKDSDWLILVFVHSAKPTAELENLAVSPSLSSPGLSYDTKFVHIGWELRSSLVGDTILGVQSEPACTTSTNKSQEKTANLLAICAGFRISTGVFLPGAQEWAFIFFFRHSRVTTVACDDRYYIPGIQIVSPVLLLCYFLGSVSSIILLFFHIHSSIRTTMQSVGTKRQKVLKPY